MEGICEYFTETLVLKAFSATGIHPLNANVILDRFRTATPETAATPPEQTALSSSSGEPLWLKAKSLLRSATKGGDAIATNALAQYIHHLPVQNQQSCHDRLYGLKYPLILGGQFVVGEILKVLVNLVLLGRFDVFDNV